MKISGMVRGKKKEKKGQEGGMTENVEKKKVFKPAYYPSHASRYTETQKPS